MPDNTTELAEGFIAGIRQGSYDRWLAEIKFAVLSRENDLRWNRSRRDDIEDGEFESGSTQEAPKSISVIRPGDTVEFLSHIRPKYMAGELAKVIKVNRKSVTVEMARTYSNRFKQGDEVRCPITLIRVVSQRS